MEILLISPLCPLPLEKGGAVRIWNIAKLLSKNHSLDLVCFIRDESEKSYESELKTVFKNVTFIQRKKLFNAQYLLSSLSHMIEFFTQNLSLLWQALFSSRPLLSLLYNSPEMREFVIKADKSGKYDLLYAETYYSISSLKDDLESLKTKLLLIEQNIESEVYGRHADSQGFFLLQQLMQWDVGKMREEERFFWNNVGYVGGLSDIDCETIKNSVKKDVVCVTNGVDVSFFSEPVAERVHDEVLFVGSFKYAPNVAAVRYLIEEVWPKLVAVLPLHHTVRLRIVGRGADDVFKQYVQAHGFSIDESVEDIRIAFQHATVMLAPLQSGSGTKYKVLESMASRLPVVTTSVGAEGLDVVSGRDLYISDSAAGMAEQVVILLNDAQKRTEIAETGYLFVKNRYDWSSIVSKLENDLVTIVKK